MLTKDNKTIKNGDTMWYSFRHDKTSIHGSIMSDYFNTSLYNVFKYKKNAIEFSK